ncbi:MAG: hypothetical protein LUD83_02105 [Clostridiales bacterium]|nr:hypothetical protein [Clostridiales bacterium]
MICQGLFLHLVANIVKFQKDFLIILKAKIAQAAQAILDARTLYLDSSLADHDQLTMPSELCKVHQNNDRAVMQAYGFSVKNMRESCCVKAYEDVSDHGNKAEDLCSQIFNAKAHTTQQTAEKGEGNLFIV